MLMDEVKNSHSKDQMSKEDQEWINGYFDGYESGKEHGIQLVLELLEKMK